MSGDASSIGLARRWFRADGQISVVCLLFGFSPRQLVHAVPLDLVEGAGHGSAEATALRDASAQLRGHS